MKVIMVSSPVCVWLLTAAQYFPSGQGSGTTVPSVTQAVPLGHVAHSASRVVPANVPGWRFRLLIVLTLEFDQAIFQIVS